MLYPWNDDGATYAIPLSRDQVTVIDAADYALVSQFKWYAHRRTTGWYAATGVDRRTKRGYANGHRYLHRLLAGDGGPGLEVDHRDGDSLNNRRANLRWVTRAQNIRNSRLSRASTNGFKGVTRDKRRDGWIAQIKVDGRHLWLGSFTTPEEAAVAYDAKAVELFGEYARVNFPLEGDRALPLG